MTNTILFDPAISGHHSEYIVHLIKYILNNKKEVNYYFIVNNEFIKKFGGVKIEAESSSSIKIIEITNREYDLIYSAGNLIERSLNEFKIMNSYALKYKADHCILLYANGLQFALGLYKTKYIIHGILFGQYTWQTFPSNFKGWLYKKRKEMQTKWMLRNKKLRSIFLLNDIKSCLQLNQIHNTNVFKYLPDPVADFQSDTSFNLRSDFNIPLNHKIYLHVGSLEYRKGTLDIIDSIKYLDEDIRLNTTIVIMGRASISFDLLIKQKITEVTTNFNASIIYENQFVPNSKLKSLFEQTDFILMPYRNTQASSGILGHAIVNKKIIIGPRGGLLGCLIAENKIGYLFDSIDSISIAGAITYSFQKLSPIYQEDQIRTEYLNTHTTDEFASIILNQVQL